MNVAAFSYVARWALLLLAGLTSVATIRAAGPVSAAPPPLQVYCGAGDHWWTAVREPVDSEATIDAMFEWMADTYHIGRMYWRGGQQEIWQEQHRFGLEAPLTYDSERRWAQYMISEIRTNEIAVRAAKRHGMQIELYTGLFEHGVQPDQGILSPHPWEDRVRIEHPEWCMLDRWGERRAPGPLSFAQPEVRELLVKRYADFVNSRGYDGIVFYTYAENDGTRYLEEFGFSEPVLAEFAKRYPGVDPRRERLDFDQKAHLAVCRGRFVTDFLRQLHGELKARGKTLTIALDAKNPDRGQPWWSRPPSAACNIAMEWERWIREGVVDGLYVQLAAVADQQRLLDRLLPVTRGTPVVLSVRTSEPFKDASWAKYTDAGVTLSPCITSPINGLDRITHAAITPGTLASPDWKVRVQTLADIGAGLLPPDPAGVAAATRDPHVLVRRKAVQTLAALKDASQLPAIEAALRDPEHSVRVTAVVALKAVHGPGSAEALLAAVSEEKFSSFLVRLTAVETLAAMGPTVKELLLKGTTHASEAVRETCIRSLRYLKRDRVDDAAFTRLREIVASTKATASDRYWAAIALNGMSSAMTDDQRETVARAMLEAVRGNPPPIFQIRAAMILGEFQPTMAPATRLEAINALGRLFERYGADSKRTDAAFGWRIVGNALDRFGQRGRDVLEGFRVQKNDPWLAWFAYEVSYLPLRRAAFELTTEDEAVAVHEKYAPRFPGWRVWNQPDDEAGRPDYAPEPWTTAVR